MNLIAIGTACARECARQRVGLDGLERLVKAYSYALLWSENGLPSTLHVRRLAATIEPRTTGIYRDTPVVFSDGGNSATPSTIFGAVTRLFSLLDESTDVDEFIRAFLQIHPFIDGNGRIAFVLYNWLTGTLFDPLPLPYYFGRE